MIKLLVVPDFVFEQFQNDGVQFNKLLSANYIATVASVNDLVAIDRAINDFPFSFCSLSGIERAPSPVYGVGIAANSDEGDNYVMQQLQRRLEERIATNALQKASEQPLPKVYSLYSVDENLWVAVQKSLHNQNGDPKRLSLVSNRAFFDSMINELTSLPGYTFETVAKTNLFTYYLESQI